MDKVGLTEALVLNALNRPSTVIEIADRLLQRIDDPAVYLALKRMLGRGLVTRETVTTKASDGKQRQVGRYRITGAGSRALDAYCAKAAPLRTRLAEVMS